MQHCIAASCFLHEINVMHKLLRSESISLIKTYLFLLFVYDSFTNFYAIFGVPR